MKCTVRRKVFIKTLTIYTYSESQNIYLTNGDNTINVMINCG